MSVNVVQDNFRDSLIDRNATIALVMYARTAANDKELSVAKGEYLEVRSNHRGRILYHKLFFVFPKDFWDFLKNMSDFPKKFD